MSKKIKDLKCVPPSACILKLPSLKEALAFAEEERSVPEGIRGVTDWWVQPQRETGVRRAMRTGFDLYVAELEPDRDPYYGIRPALYIPSADRLGLKNGNVFSSGGYTWKMNTDCTAICAAVVSPLMTYSSVDRYLKEFAWKHGFSMTKEETFFKGLMAKYTPEDVYRKVSKAISLKPVIIDQGDLENFKEADAFLTDLMELAKGGMS